MTKNLKYNTNINIRKSCVESRLVTAFPIFHEAIKMYNSFVEKHENREDVAFPNDVFKKRYLSSI